MSIPENKTSRTIQNIKELVKSILIVVLAVSIISIVYYNRSVNIHVKKSGNVSVKNKKVNMVATQDIRFNNLVVSNTGFANDFKPRVSTHASNYGHPGKGFVITNDMIKQMSRAYDFYVNNNANPLSIGGFHVYYADTNGATSGGEAVAFYPLNASLVEHPLLNNQLLFYLSVEPKIAAPCPTLCDSNRPSFQQYTLH